MDAATNRTWADLNLRIADALAAQPETLSLWYDIAPTLIEAMAPLELTRWSEPIAEFVQYPPRLVQSYLRSGHVAAALNATQLDRWAEFVRRFAVQGWKSVDLACRIMDTSESLVAISDFDSLARLAELLHETADRNSQLATDCLASAKSVLEAVPRGNHRHFLMLAVAVARKRRAELWQCFEQAAALFGTFSPAIAGEFSALGIAIIDFPDEPAMALLSDVAGAMTPLDNAAHALWFGQARRIAAIDAVAAGRFLIAAPTLRRSLAPQHVVSWVDAGIAGLPRENPSAACRAFFSVESADAGEALTALSGRVEFSQVGHLLQLFGQAVGGEAVQVRPRVEPGARLRTATQPEGDDDIVIEVPASFDAFASRESNFNAYKVCIAHHAVRLQFGAAAPDLQRRIETLDDAALARHLIAIVEDGRIDAKVRDEYPGLAAALAMLGTHAAAGRPSPDTLALRQAFVENLLRASLGAPERVRWPASLMHIMATAVGVMNLAATPAATVEESATVAHWLYDLARAIPNIDNPACPAPWVALEDSAVPRFAALPAQPVIPVEVMTLGPLRDMQWPAPPEFRAVFAPPAAGVAANADMLDAEALQHLLDNAEAASGEDATMTVTLPADAEPEGDEGPGDAAPGSAVAWYTYDEWDCRSHAYRAGWCRVGVRVPNSAGIGAYDEILARQHAVVSALRKQFELMRPEYQRRVKGLYDGHDIDLERAISFVVDRKAGAGPAPRFYTRRDKIERSVAAAFLFDLSYSTDETIPSREDTKIIDVERDAMVLVSEALEAVGDTYGVFGFSGRGREDVAFYTFKGLDEPFGTDVKRRIAAVTPLSATRMGAAIRHTRRLLDEAPAAVKLLILVSDGRPQDRDYGNPDEPWGYGIQDTAQALIEARRGGMVPFLITVDRQGPDYLEAMCSGFGYEVVSDAAALPGRLPVIYRYLAGN